MLTCTTPLVGNPGTVCLSRVTEEGGRLTTSHEEKTTLRQLCYWKFAAGAVT